VTVPAGQLQVMRARKQASPDLGHIKVLTVVLFLIAEKAITPKWLVELKMTHDRHNWASPPNLHIKGCAKGGFCNLLNAPPLA
jgi:hypothetical protein